MLPTICDLLHNNSIIKYDVIYGNNMLSEFVTGIISRDTSREDWNKSNIYLFEFKNNIFDENLLIEILQILSKSKMFLFILANENNKLNPSYLQIISRYKNKLDIPIIIIYSVYSYLEIINHLMYQIHQAYFDEYHKTREVYNNFSYLSLKGKGLDAILHYFSEIIGNPVAVFDIDQRCIASTSMELNNFFQINNTAIKENLYNLYYFKQKINISTKSNKKNEITQILFPITINEKVKAYLSVFETDRTLKYSEYFILEVAATAAMIEMKKRIVIKAMEDRFINDLIYDLINNKIDDYGIVYERAKLIGLKSEEKHIVVLFEIKSLNNYDFKNSQDSYETYLDKLFTEISRQIYKSNHYCIVGKLSNLIITLWPFSSTGYDVELTNIKEMSRNIQNYIRSKFHNQLIIIGIGKPAENISVIHKSYREAKDAILLGATILGDNAIIGFKDLGVLRLISKIEDKNSLMEIIPEELIRLKQYDEINNTDLLETLRVYLECNGNASKAALELFIHYKTMLYRLEKINKICKINLENYHECLEVGIGIKILNLLDNNR